MHNDVKGLGEPTTTEAPIAPTYSTEAGDGIHINHSAKLEARFIVIGAMPYFYVGFYMTMLKQIA